MVYGTVFVLDKSVAVDMLYRGPGAFLDYVGLSNSEYWLNVDVSDTLDIVVVHMEWQPIPELTPTGGWL